MWKIEKFLCFNLFTAGILIGWISIMTCFVVMLLCITLLFQMDSLVNVVSIVLEEDKLQPDSNELKDFLTSALKSSIASNIAEATSAVLLLIGTAKRNHFFILPWILITGLDSFFLSMFAITAMIYFVYNLNLTGILFVCALLPIWAFNYYTWLAVYSLFHKIRKSVRTTAFEEEEEEEEETEKIAQTSA